MSGGGSPRPPGGAQEGAGPDPLPGILAVVEEEIGREGAIMFALDFGGEEIHVPRGDYLLKIGPSHRLIGILGADDAAAVARRLNGCRIYVPRARPQIARALRAQGHDVREISILMHLPPKRIRRYLRGSGDA